MTKKSFQLRLRKSRENLGWTQTELAQAAGLNASQISHFESGQRRPSFDNIGNIANALGVSIDYLCGRVEQCNQIEGLEESFSKAYLKLNAKNRKVALDFVKLLSKSYG